MLQKVTYSIGENEFETIMKKDVYLFGRSIIFQYMGENKYIGVEKKLYPIMRNSFFPELTIDRKKDVLTLELRVKSSIRLFYCVYMLLLLLFQLIFLVSCYKTGFSVVTFIPILFGVFINIISVICVEITFRIIVRDFNKMLLVYGGEIISKTRSKYSTAA